MAIPQGPFADIEECSNHRAGRQCGFGESARAARVRRYGAKSALVAVALFLMAACARDDELALRSRLDQWFFLGGTAYFSSGMRCTGAMFHVTVDRPRPNLAVQDHPEKAKDALRTSGVAAIQVDGMTPADLTDVMLLAGAGVFGKQALAAGALAGPCFEGSEIGAFLYDGLTRAGATLAYDNVNEGLMILDPERNRLFYVASDVW